MPRRIAQVTAFVLALTLGAGIATAQFDETPGIPLPVHQSASYPEFSYSVTHTEPSAWFHSPGQGFEAQHGANCSGPPDSHHVINYDDMVYVCNAHVMTALDAGSAQASLSLTPNKLLDWTNGPATFQFEMSTKIMSNRDWPDFIIVPFESAMGGWYVDNNVTAKTGLNVFSYTWVLKYIQDHQYVHVADGNNGIWNAIVPGTNQAAARQPFKFTISRTHARMEMLPGPFNVCATQPNRCLFFDTDIPDTQTTLGMTKGVVQVGHHSYNPTKGVEHGENLSVLGEGKPATWHWDEFRLECNPGPCQTINFIRGDKRQSPGVPSGQVWDDTINFTTPAPTGSYLRFNSSGHVVRLSFDNGATWENARCTFLRCREEDGHNMLPYFHPVPQGKQSVRIHLEMHAGHQIAARDFEIWSLNTPAQATATPSATASPTPPMTTTPTPQLPSPTATIPGPTATPVPPTATAPPATVQPTATSTAGPTTCEVRVRVNGVEGWVRRPLSFCQDQ